MFVATHRQIVKVLRNNKYLKKVMRSSNLIYPGLAMFIIASITYPRGAGQYIGGSVSDSLHRPTCS